MANISSLGNFFALDIGNSAVRVAQLSPISGGWDLKHFGYVVIDEQISSSSSPEGMRRLGEAVKQAVAQANISERDVVIGLPSTKTFTAVIDVPQMPINELKNTLKYQADQYIPMSIDEAKFDWALLGQSLHDPKQQEVLIASTAISYAEDRLEFIESLGFNVVAAEPDAIAMVRSLLPANIGDARMIIDMGDISTDLAVTYGDCPRLIRTIPIGLRTFVKVASQNLNISEEQSKQFILKFGLDPTKLDSQVFRALEGTLDNFASELTKSIKFFQSRYPNIPIGSVLISGSAAIIPQFVQYVSSGLNMASSVANPWQNIRVSNSDQQQLAPVASEFATVLGLAQKRGV